MNKILLTFTAVIFLVAGPGRAGAQDFTLEPGKGGIEAPLSLVFRYTGTMKTAPLETILKRVPGVLKVEIKPESRTLHVLFSGGSARIASVESALAGNGVAAPMISHARIAISLKSTRKDAASKSFKEELSKVGGFRFIRFLSGTSAELCADLDVLDASAIRTAADAAGFEVKWTGHEWISLAVSGQAIDEFEKDLVATPGVVSVRIGNETVGLWTTKKLGDAVFKKLAEKYGLNLGEIAR